jgi:Cu2+-exporting ATPase
MDHTAHASHVQHAGAHAGHDIHAAHGAHAGHSEAMFKRPFWIALALTIPAVVYADMIQMLLGYTAPAFPGSEYLGLVLGSVIFWYGGWVFLTGAIGEIRSRAPGMMTLVALAITTAYAYSLAITLGVAINAQTLRGLDLRAEEPAQPTLHPARA